RDRSRAQPGDEQLPRHGVIVPQPAPRAKGSRSPARGDHCPNGSRHPGRTCGACVGRAADRSTGCDAGFGAAGARCASAGLRTGLLTTRAGTGGACRTAGLVATGRAAGAGASGAAAGADGTTAGAGPGASVKAAACKLAGAGKAATDCSGSTTGRGFAAA